LDGLDVVVEVKALKWILEGRELGCVALPTFVMKVLAPSAVVGERGI
jgi:hypothetical protein